MNYVDQVPQQPALVVRCADVVGKVETTPKISAEERKQILARALDVAMIRNHELMVRLSKK